MKTFGRLIATTRIARNMKLKDLAELILKADGSPISISYLGTLEQERCHPSSSLIPQFASALDLPEDLLYFALGLLPPDIQELSQVTHQKIPAVFQMVRYLLSLPDGSKLVQDVLWHISLLHYPMRFGACQHISSFGNIGLHEPFTLLLRNSTRKTRNSITARKRAALLRTRTGPSSRIA